MQCYHFIYQILICVILSLNLADGTGRGPALPKACYSTINIMDDQGAYIENYAWSGVTVNPLWKSFHSGHILNFEMNMTSSNGVVFYLLRKSSYPSEFIALEVVDGFFRYHIKCRHLEAMLTIPGTQITRRKWQKISYRRRGSHGKLIINGKKYFANYPVHCGGFTSLALGGVAYEDRNTVSTLANQHGHFSGCIRNVDISTGMRNKPQYRLVSQCS